MTGRAPGPSLVLHGSVLTDGRELGTTRVELDAGRITAVTPGALPEASDVMVDGWIVPGLIDLQVNGACGVDLTYDSRPEQAVAAVARTLVRHGVTAFCPTIVSCPPATILERIPAYGAREHPDGAGSLGAHLEGPFLSPEHRGAHAVGSIRPPDEHEIERWLSVGAPTIVTLAPELPDALGAIRRLAAGGTIVSLGHSGADAVVARSALSAGATMGTHLFNGMPTMHHRQPGLAAALLLGAATLGLICDGVHVHPLATELVIRLSGVERVALVSDAAPPAGTAATEVDSNAGVRLADGTLAGSAIFLDACLRNARKWSPWLSPAQVVLMATATPAAALGRAIASRKGRIAPGYDADITVLDADWDVVMTIVGGRIVFRRSDA